MDHRDPSPVLPPQNATPGRGGKGQRKGDMPSCLALSAASDDLVDDRLQGWRTQGLRSEQTIR